MCFCDMTIGSIKRNTINFLLEIAHENGIKFPFWYEKCQEYNFFFLTTCKVGKLYLQQGKGGV